MGYGSSLHPDIPSGVGPSPGITTRANLGGPSMKNLITAVVLLTLLRSPAAIAQTTGSARWSTGPVGPIMSSQLMPQARSISTAPVGHRQPRASDVPSENSSSSDIDHISAEDAEVDRKINNICRGC
jgi:hypothetical protein